MIIYYFKELKTRFIFCLYALVCNVIFCFVFLEELLFIAIEPISYFKGFNFIFTEISNAFFSYTHLIIIFSILLTLPFVLFNFFFFLSPSLYKYEYILIIYIFICSFALFVFSLIFINKIFLPIILNFFFKFELVEYPFQIFFEGRIDTYLIFFIQIFYLFVTIFQLPLIMILLFVLKIINLEILFNYRKLFYFAFIIVAAIVTPPDLLSQILLIIPFFLFFELTIFLLILFNNYSKINSNVI